MNCLERKLKKIKSLKSIVSDAVLSEKGEIRKEDIHRINRH